jgi:ketosteroid isomerase-like protein
MKCSFVFASIAIVASMALAPLIASAQTLTPAQTSAVTAATTSYFKALWNGDHTALAAMTTPDYQRVGPDGKPLSDANLAAQVAKVQLHANNIAGSMKINSVTGTPTTITEVATITGTATQMTGGENSGPSRTTASSQHRLTWQKSASGKWLVAKDAMTGPVKVQ